MRAVVLDVDNTLADTAAEWVALWGPPADPSDYDAYVPEGFDFASEVALQAFGRARPVEGAVEAVRQLAAAGWWPVYATARPARALTVTLAWLEERGFPMSPLAPLPMCGRTAKRHAIRTFYTAPHAQVAYVDDRPTRLSANMRSVLVLPHRRPWRPDGLTWPEIAEALRRV